MKKYLLSVILLASCVVAVAQTPVWDDALGTPRSGSYALSADAGSLSIRQTVPYSPDEDWSVVADNLDMGFRSSGQTWIRVTGISQINGTTVSIHIAYAKNTSKYSRSAFLGTSGRHIEILQKPATPVPVPDPDPDPTPEPEPDPDPGDSGDYDDDYPGPEEFPGDPDIPEMTCPSSGTNADTSRNFILVELPGGSASRKTITYHDGLGMPEQRRLIDCAQGSDLVSLHAHDVFGREVRAYLPYVGDGPHGAFDAEGVSRQFDWYCGMFSESDALAAFTSAGYEPFAEGRQTTAALPGEILSRHPSTVRYLTNKADEVDLVDVDAEDGSARLSGHYPAGSLTGTVTTDGDGRVSAVWKDFDGRAVCTECGSGDELSRTLYGYDFRGNLCWVMMPEGYARLAAGLENGDGAEDGSGIRTDVAVRAVEISIDGEFAEKHCYRYRYDSRGRMTAMYCPGAGLTLMAYDRAGNPLFLQDEKMRAENRRLTYRYDQLGRVTRMGISTDGSGADWAASLPELDTDALIEMRNKSDVSYRELTYDYHPAVMDSRLGFDAGSDTDLEAAFSGDARGRLAYELVHTVDGLQQVERAYHYDRHGNVIQTVELRPEGVLRTSFLYDLQKRLLRRHDTFAYNGQEDSPDVFLQEFTYDGSGRLVSERCSLNGHATVTEYGYDGLGRLTSKTHRDPTSAEIAENGNDQIDRGRKVNESYAYNMQGWEAEHEAESTRYGRYYGDSHVYYDDTHKGIVLTPSYTGNVSMVSFSRGDGTLTTYDAYAYDSQDRLSGMHEYTDVGAQQSVPTLTDGHVEKDMRYDLNGNILSMVRVNGAGPDTLRFEYDGNRRKGFEYDANGNVTRDNVSFVDAEYNMLNLPARVYDFGGSDYWVTVTYLADGTKLSSVQDEYWNGRYYAGPFVYATNDMMDGELLHASFSNGRIVKTEDGYHDVIYIRDMLGSTRAEILDKQTAYRTFDYLPFGELTSNGTDIAKMYNDNLFTGKEFQSEFGVSWYDSRARWLTTHGIFTSQDPLGDSTPSVSPYSYCANNPVNRVDPDGLDWYRNDDGDLKWANSAASKLTIDNMEYNNVGRVLEIHDGEKYKYYYQKYLALSSMSPIENVEDIVLNNASQRSMLLNDSSLSDDIRNGIMQRYIHMGHEDFLNNAKDVAKMEARLMGDAASYAGNAVAIVNPALGTGLAKLGNLINLSVTTVDLVENIVKGNKKEAYMNAVNLYAGLLSWVLPRNVSVSEEVAFNLIFSPISIVSSKTNEK